jgi:hypothetical protein
VVQFNPQDGKLYVGVNPNSTGFNWSDNRPLTVGELIAHGVAHFSDAARALNPWDSVGIERVAVDYANGVARDFGLSTTQAFRVGTYAYGPLLCTADDPTGTYRVPRFLSNCFVRGTAILMEGGAERAIDAIMPGDLVMAFDPSNGPNGDLVPRRVARTFTNLTTELFILRAADGSHDRISEVFVTPGHVFFRADGSFARIDDILNDDALLIWKDGSPLKITGERVVYSAETADCFEQASTIDYVVAGSAALSPQIKRGWRTYNFEVEGPSIPTSPQAACVRTTTAKRP